MEETNITTAVTEMTEAEGVEDIGAAGEPGDIGPAGNPEAASGEGQKSLEELFGLTHAPEPEEGPETDESASAQPEEPSEQTPEADGEPDYKSLYETLLNSTREEKSRETFRRVYGEQKAAGMTDAAARLVAKDAAGGREFSLTDESPASAAPPNPAEALTRLRRVAPELTEVPPEVTRAILDGGDPVAAYMGWQRTQDRKTIEDLQAKVRDMEQKAANVVHAVARGVSGNGARQEPDHPFLQGMMDEDW